MRRVVALLLLTLMTAMLAGCRKPSTPSMAYEVRGGGGGARADVQGKTVTGVADLHLAALTDPAADDRREIRRKSPFAEDPVGLGEQFARRLRGRDQAAKNRVQLRHEHGSSYSLAGDIPDDEEG